MEEISKWNKNKRKELKYKKYILSHLNKLEFMIDLGNKQINSNISV